MFIWTDHFPNRQQTLKVVGAVNKKVEKKEGTETATKKTIARINKSKSWFSEKVNNIDIPLARLTEKKRERTAINKIRNERGEVTTDTAEMQSILRDEYKQLYANKMDNLEEMDKFWEKHNLWDWTRKKQKI